MLRYDTNSLDFEDDEDYEGHSELSNPIGAKVHCSIAGTDFIAAGLTQAELPYLTIVGANAEYTVIPSREGLLELRDGINKLLILTEK